MSEEERLKWVDYLDEENSGAKHGSFQDRYQEYEQVYSTLLLDLGFAEHDLIVDVGAGTNDADRAFRSLADFSFKYLPVCGSVQGIDLNKKKSWKTVRYFSDFYISIETIEHLWDTRFLIDHIEKYAKKGAVITTPNPACGIDVQSLDATHYSAVSETQFKRWGYEVRQVNFCGRSRVEGQGDALIAWKSFSK